MLTIKANDVVGREFITEIEKNLKAQEKIRDLFESFIMENGFLGYHIQNGYVYAPNGLKNDVQLTWREESISHSVWKPDVTGSNMVIIEKLPSLPYELIFPKQYFDVMSLSWKNVSNVSKKDFRVHRKNFKPFKMYCYTVIKYNDRFLDTGTFELKFTSVQNVIFDVRTLGFQLYRDVSFLEEIKRVFSLK